MARLTIDGYGQLELNNVAFRRNGRVEAQCKLNESDITEEEPEEKLDELVEEDAIHFMP